MYDKDLEVDPDNFTKYKVGDKVTYNGKEAVILDIKPFIILGVKLILQILLP